MSATKITIADDESQRLDCSTCSASEVPCSTVKDRFELIGGTIAIGNRITLLIHGRLFVIQGVGSRNIEFSFAFTIVSRVTRKLSFWNAHFWPSTCSIANRHTNLSFGENIRLPIFLQMCSSGCSIFFFWRDSRERPFRKTNRSCQRDVVCSVSARRCASLPPGDRSRQPL